MSDWGKARRTELTVKFNNVDISGDLGEHLISLSYTDQSEGAADDLKIRINDRKGKWVRQWLTRDQELGREEETKETAQAAESGGGNTTYTVTAKIGLNVRAGKGTNTARLGGLPYGQSIQVEEISEGWAKISYSGQTAYVSAQYLTPAAGNTGSGGGTWNIGDEVTVTGTPQYSSYGIGRPGTPVTGYKGHISHLNLRDGVA